MHIKELYPRQGKIDIELEIVEVSQPRSFERFGKKGRVTTATAKDETGTVKLTLWNEEIDLVKAGDKIKITNGYCSEFQGEKQLTAGRFGKLEVIKN